MLQTVENILEEVKAVSDNSLLEPDDEVEPAEQIIGEMSLLQKKARTYLRNISTQMIQCKLDFMAALNGEVKINAISKVNLLGMKGDLLFNWFWLNIREEFEVPEGNVGVRKGFQVVSFPDSHTPKADRGLPH